MMFISLANTFFCKKDCWVLTTEVCIGFFLVVLSLEFGSFAWVFHYKGRWYESLNGIFTTIFVVLFAVFIHYHDMIIWHTHFETIFVNLFCSKHHQQHNDGSRYRIFPYIPATETFYPAVKWMRVFFSWLKCMWFTLTSHPGGRPVIIPGNPSKTQSWASRESVSSARILGGEVSQGFVFFPKKHASTW